MKRRHPVDLASAIEAFLVSEERAGKAALTVLNYRADLVALLRSMGTRPSAARVAAAAVQHLERLRVAERSWNRHLSTLRRFCQFMVEAKLITRNPLRDVQRLAVVEQEPQTASARDLDLVMDRVESLRDQTLIALLWDQGLRISEALQLRKVDVDLERGAITVGRDPARCQKLAPRTRELLKRYLSRRPGGDEDPLFTSRGARPLSYAAAHRSFRQYAGDTGITLRHLRASAAAAAFGRGASLAQVQAMMGHLHATSTARYRFEDYQAQTTPMQSSEKGASYHGKTTISPQRRRHSAARS